MVFMTYGELIEALANGFHDTNFSTLLPNLEDQIGLSSDLFCNFIDPSISIYDFKQNYRVDPIGVFLHLVTQEAVANSISTTIFHNSKLLARIGNEHVLALDSLTTGINNLRDLSRITSVYLSRPDKSIQVFRVYPTASSSNSRGGITGNINTLENIRTSAIKQINEALGTSQKIAQENLDRVAKAFPVNGRISTQLEMQSKKLMNAIKVDFGSTRGANKEQLGVKIKKIESKDLSGNPVTVADFGVRNLGLGMLSSAVIPITPTITDALMVHLETSKNTKEIDILEMTPLKIRYKGDGKIAEREFSTAQPITNISIIDEDYELPETAREYFDSIHEIKLDTKDEWLKIKPRNSDNYESSLPEIILIGSQYSLPGVLNIQTEEPITKFKYRASFKRKANIPSDVLLDLYARRLNRETKRIITPLSSLGNEDSVINLSGYPLEKPRVYVLDQGVITDDKKAALFLGYNLVTNLLELPKSYLEVIDKTRLVVMKNNEELTWTSNAAPSSTEFTVDSEGKLIFDSNSRNGEEIKTYLKPEPLTIIPSQTSNPYYTFTLEYKPGFTDGNLRLFRKTYPTSTTVTFNTTNLQETFDNVYLINLDNAGVSSYTVKALDENLNDVTSSVFINENTYASGIENTTDGDYSFDYINGRLYLRLNTFQKLTIAVNYTYSDEIEETNNIVPFLESDSSDVYKTQKSFNFTSLTETIPAGTKSLVLGSSLSIWDDWQIVNNSIKINGYSQNSKISNLQYVENVIVKKTSNISGISTFKLPLVPLDSEHEVLVSDTNSFITSRSALGDGGWDVTDAQTIQVNDSSDVLEHIIVSYTFKKTSQTDLTKDFVYYPTSRTIEFGETTTEDLVIKYDIQSYYATYMISSEIEDQFITFDNETRKDIKIKKNVFLEADSSNNTDQTNKKVLVVYPQIKQDASRDAEVTGNDPSDYLTVLPRHIDIEVGTT